MTPQAFVQAAADAGYDAIDLVPHEYFALVRDAGLRISSIRGHESIEHGLNDPREHARIEREMRDNIALAVEWNIPNLICFSGNRAAESDDIGARNSVECLRRVTPFAEKTNITLILELLNSKHDHPRYQADHTAWSADIVRAVNSPNVKLLYDIYHMQIMEGDVIHTINTYHTDIAHYHTAGVPGRHELDDLQELNYSAILRAIKATGFDGYVAHEFVPRGNALDAIKQTIKMCRAYL